MRWLLRKRGLFLYRILFGIVFVLTIVFLIKGFIVLASDGLGVTFSNLGARAMRSLYVNSTASKNHYYDYVIKNQSTGNTLITKLAENFSINYFVAHENSWKQENTDNFEGQEYDYEYAENLDEDNRHYINIESDLEEKVIGENEMNPAGTDPEKTLEIVFTEGKVSYIENYDSSSYMKDFVLDESENFAVSVSNLIKSQYSLEKLKKLDFLLQNYYIVDSSTKATADMFNTQKLLDMDLTIEKKKDKPQILIYHTHATEAYADSREGVQEDTVVGAGKYLTELLTGYGYNVIHDTTQYDMKNGVSNRNYAYSTARPSIEQILKDNPNIEVIIDLHRDSGEKRVTTINGKPTAQVMLFNGLSRDQNGPIERLENENLQTNLAFSLQTNLVGRSLFPGLMYRIYLKNYRYNQHLTGRYLLVELGTNNNTVEEAYNAIEPFAVVLDQVLSNR